MDEGTGEMQRIVIARQVLGSETVHTQAALFGFLLYTLVMFLGFLIAWGSILIAGL